MKKFRSEKLRADFPFPNKQPPCIPCSRSASHACCCLVELAQQRSRAWLQNWRLPQGRTHIGPCPSRRTWMTWKAIATKRDSLSPTEPWVRRNSRRLWRSRRRKSSSDPASAANFPAAVFPAGRCPNLGRDSISRCRKIGESFSSSAEICRKNFPAGNFGQPQPSRVF